MVKVGELLAWSHRDVVHLQANVAGLEKPDSGPVAVLYLDQSKLEIDGNG
jgi:hypothetical protein